jgi:hypothetical protein
VRATFGNRYALNGLLYSSASQARYAGASVPNVNSTVNFLFD